jgi:hypothetical protein
MIAKGGDPRYLKERTSAIACQHSLSQSSYTNTQSLYHFTVKEKQYIARAKKYKSFHGMKKHLEGESSLVYVNKVEKNEEFVSDLRDRDQELMADKKEREARKRAARLDENAKINAALQGITRLRKLKKRRRHHSHKDDEAEDNGSDSEQGDEFLASLSEDARAGLALLKSQGRVIDKDGKIRKQTLVEVAKEARVKKHLEAVERAREREEHQQKIQSNIDKRRKLSMKHRMRTPKGQPLLKNMVFDMVRKLKSDRKQ